MLFIIGGRFYCSSGVNKAFKPAQCMRKTIRFHSEAHTLVEDSVLCEPLTYFCFGFFATTVVLFHVMDLLISHLFEPFARIFTDSSLLASQLSLSFFGDAELGSAFLSMCMKVRI